MVTRSKMMTIISPIPNYQWPNSFALNAHKENNTFVKRKNFPLFVSANSEMLGVKESDSPFVRKHLGSRCSPSLSRKEKNSDYFHAVSSSLKPGDVAVEHLVLGASGLFRSLKFRWILRRKILPTDDQRIYHMPPRQFSILMSVFLLSW